MKQLAIWLGWQNTPTKSLVMRKLASGSRGARHPHVLLVHSGACAPGFPDVSLLATIFAAMFGN